MKKTILSLLLVLTVLNICGCSVFMAASQPNSKNTSILKVGTPKSMIIAEYGSPIGMENKMGRTYEIYNFQNGCAPGYKASKAALYIVADIFTAFISEIITTPIETAFRTSDHSFEVSYDKNNIVDSIIILKQ